MITVAVPVQYIAALWSRPEHREGETFRPMRYVLRVDHDGRVLLHNVVTGQLAVLEPAEAEILDRLPMRYHPAMDQLIDAHYLVAEQFDEHHRFVKMREALRKMLVHSSEWITNYTILPTTACNARCYYCYEHGVLIHTMTEKTADDTVKFINDHCGPDKKVSIRWFGGEPTVAADRIDRICEGLVQIGISFKSSMTTNGYLLDEEMVSRAKNLWNLRDVMISVDGTERNYNEIKAYVGAEDNPYQRVMRNIGLLLEKEIRVELRMNFDLGNWRDFEPLMKEAAERWPENPFLMVHVFPVKGEYPCRNGQILHGSDEWFDGKIAELNDKARDAGLFRRIRDLPALYFDNCSAGDPGSILITPEGKLARCAGMFDREDQIIGNVTDGVTVPDPYAPWQQFAEPGHCANCVFLPKCVLIEKCSGKDRCFLKETHRQYEETIRSVYEDWKISNGLQGGMQHVFEGAQSRVCPD